MPHSLPFGSRSTADEVLAGVDLSRRRFLVTECATDTAIGTMRALAANGAQVVGLAKAFDRAQSACRKADMSVIPMVCDFTTPASVAAAAHALRSFQWDGVIANATNAYRPSLRTCNGIEEGFLTEYIAHFILINRLLEGVRDRTGRIVINSGDPSIKNALDDGIMFDNLDGRRFYDPFRFQKQAQLAAGLYGKELSRRVAVRGIAVNWLNPDRTRHSARGGGQPLAFRLLPSVSGLFAKSDAQAAATPVLLAASPLVAGITGERWADCGVNAGGPWWTDHSRALRLWEVSDQIARRVYPLGSALDGRPESEAQSVAKIAYLTGKRRDRSNWTISPAVEASTGGRHES